eukprot:GSMAST32.ASY1.ANO1.1475.1 assembled CDS
MSILVRTCILICIFVYIFLLCPIDVYAFHAIASDKRVKKNVMPVDTLDSMRLLKRLSLKEFEYVSSQFESARFKNRRHVGVFAQELLAVLPDAVTVMPSINVHLKDEEKKMEVENFHMINPTNLFWTNIAATQQLISEFEYFTGFNHNITSELGSLQDELGLVQLRLLKEAELELVNKRKLKEAEVRLAELWVEKERTKGDQDRKSLEFKAKQEAANVEYDDRLSRERNKLVSLQSEASHLEEMKAEAAMRRAQLQAEATVEAAQIEGESKIRQERENEDIAKRMYAKQAIHDRQKLIAAIKTGFRLLGEGIAHFLSSPQQLITTGLFLGVSGLMLFVTEVARRLKRPDLLRESSKDNHHFSLFNRTKQSIMKMYRRFRGIILPNELDIRLRRMALSIGNARRHGAPMRHFLFYVRKTMTARQLAHRAGLDYAIMSGGDVAPLGEQAVTELHKVMDWARSSKRGLLLFIDEAEAFLGSRNNVLSETLRNAVSAILYHTGTPQKDFMMVLATNRPGDLDMAVADRLDEALEYTLPDLQGRIKLTKLYFDKYILQHKKRDTFINHAKIEVSDDITDKVIEKVAKQMDKFSGREVDKLMLAVQAVVYGSDVCFLDAKILLKSVEFLIRDQRKKWRLLSKKTVWS